MCHPRTLHRLGSRPLANAFPASSLLQPPSSPPRWKHRESRGLVSTVHLRVLSVQTRAWRTGSSQEMFV